MYKEKNGFNERRVLETNLKRKELKKNKFLSPKNLESLKSNNLR